VWCGLGQQIRLQGSRSGLRRVKGDVEKPPTSSILVKSFIEPAVVVSWDNYQVRNSFV
jgi:hypothetical protein